MDVGRPVAHTDTYRYMPALLRQEGSAEYSITYGLPGKSGYQYKRPFDYFHFEFTAVPNASTVSNAIENVSIRAEGD